MTGRRDDRELDRLLARGRLARPEQERILEAVLAAHAPRPRRRVALWAIAGLASAAVAGALVVVSARAPAPDDGLRARAAGRAPALAAGCAGPCRAGGLLMFEIDGLERRAYVAAFARAPDGGRVWYFPSAGQPSPAVEPSAGPRALDRGVRLGPEHAPGRYTLHLLLTRAPLERDAIAALAEGRGPREALIAERVVTLEIAP